MKSLKKIIAVFSIVLISLDLYSQTNPCVTQNAIRIVVLGSSTAAGTGPSASDSAWVNRYRNYLLSLNANNEVINLAQGGYTTYKIMRTGFTPPPGRPTPDVNKNITAALALNPDGIIVNMPSNDVSSGFSYSEQIDNLDSIVALATTNNVPIWICTTQPKNFSSVTLRQLQLDLKDTILVRYAPRTIDFWTTIALSDNSINPNYDSGDGTHLNDAGHAILNSRVISTNLPLQLYVPNSTVDYSMLEAYPTGFLGCGDSITSITIVAANVGINENASTPFILKCTNQTTGVVTMDTLIQNGGILACQLDTFIFTLNFYNQGDYYLESFHLNSNDTISSNDTLSFFIQTSGHPVISAINDTLCFGGNAQFIVNTSSNDTVLWYLNSTDTFPVAGGSSFSYGSISSSTTIYAESIRGNLFYDDSLKSTLTSTVNWNGAMFDLIAQEDITIDSFLIKINTLGLQEIEFYSKVGSHNGYQTNNSAWNFQGSVFVNVTDNQNYTTVAFPSIQLNNADTLGIYFQLTNPNSLLSYRGISSPISRTTNELELITGSGVSHNFSTSYYPRDLNCGVYYHFGNRPEGDCSTGKIPVTIYVGGTNFVLGNDTIIDIDDTIIINAPTGYSSSLWFDGSNADSIIIVAVNLGYGIHYISLTLTDSLGCQVQDSLIIGVADLVGLQELKTEIYIYPNPTTDKISFSEYIEKVNVYDVTGTKIYSHFEPTNTVFLSDFSDGSYFVEFFFKNKKCIKKVIKNASSN